ncbi:phosphoribosylanthranilate isomerase [Asticcacaulis sp. YBE204]|uniref:phosphoribosylanthranilate isomerase n=1 Tax=Asticcacaulis sp. YBE204 TaxID=1282363 RepID=UPI0003C3D410|nr:phosphoribosylanthranilate isomerase [Asticcacaulis sp. YBE204]ESQ80830.1 N-(5'-phosphoribosyl)anthranilate isomerase [Asticcacaulis sp. YBE204]
MTIKTKICGIRDDDTARQAIDDSADMLGFISFPRSPRHLNIDQMAQLIANATTYALHKGRDVKCVSVLVDPDDTLLEAIVTRARPHLIQLHGHETLERVRHIRDRFKTPLIKAISVESRADVLNAALYESVVDHLLFDAKPPKDAALPGGVGARFDWTLMEGYPAKAPWLLAGGLTPWNVAEAVSQSKAPMVDVSSGVERAPGLKDPSLISQFLKAVKAI